MPVPSKKFVTFSNEGSGDATRKWIRHPTRPTDPSIGITKRCVTMHSAHRFPTKQALLFRRESPNHIWTVKNRGRKLETGIVKAGSIVRRRNCLIWGWRRSKRLVSRTHFDMTHI